MTVKGECGMGSIATPATGELAKRKHKDEPHPNAPRTPFQHDKDRITHSTAFRRLQYKTQVYVIHEGDLYRTRMTHTLEVAQIAVGLARILQADMALSL
jgi:dGTPase